MKQNEKLNSPYNKIKRNLHGSVDKNEKSHKQKIILIAIGIFLLAIALIICAVLIETSNAGMNVYYFGDTEQKIKIEGDVKLIDFIALSDYCGMTKSISSPNASFEINGTTASFISGSKIAKINGFEIEMQAEATIKNGYCLVPLAIVEDVLGGITITQDENATSITTNGQKIFMIVKNVDETNIEEYYEYIHSTNDYIYTLANKEHALDESFPENSDEILVEIPAKYRKNDPIDLHYIAEKALEAMMNDMFALGFTDVYVTSAYRTYEYQNWLFYDKYVKDEMANGLSKSEAIKKVLTYCSEPGKSEHQTGLCVDFKTNAMYDLENYGHEGKYKNDVGFAETEVFAWLKENCWKYGFILRYPEDKVDITGYSYESWHYRFVGFEAANIMHQTGLCYEEYYTEYIENTSKGDAQ